MSFQTMQQGWNQQTPAARQIMAGAFGAAKRLVSSVKRRKRAKSASWSSRKSSRKKRASSSRKPARLVKGSAAAKAYMAKIRKKRK